MLKSSKEVYGFELAFTGGEKETGLL